MYLLLISMRTACGDLHHCLDERGVLDLAVVGTLALLGSPGVPLGTCLELDSPWLRALDITDVDLFQHTRRAGGKEGM